MAYKSKICKAFFFGRVPASFAPNHPPNFPRSLPASPIQINGLPIAVFDLAELTRTWPCHGVESSGATGGCESFSGVARLVGSGGGNRSRTAPEKFSWRLDAIGR